MPPKLDLPANCCTPADLLRTRAKEHGSEVFAFYKNQKLTLEELDAQSDSLANALLRLGIEKGQKVAIISHPCLEYLICEYAILKAGAVCVPINCLLKSSEFSYLVENAEVALVFVHRNYLAEFLNSADGHIGLQDRPLYYVIEEQGISPKAGIDKESYERSLSRLLIENGEDNNIASPNRLDIRDEDPCCILYTSGTTGSPKGVVYENYGMLPRNGETYVQQMMDVIELGPSDTTYLPFALHHVLGQVHVISALRNGARIALAEKFSVSQFWSDVRNYDATVLVHQGASIPLLLKQPRSEHDRVHNVRLTVGAGVPNESAWKEFEDRFGVKVFEHYAQTEGAFFGAGTMPTNKIGTIGFPYPTAEIRIVDDRNKDVKLGEQGQLISRLKANHARKTPEALYFNDPAKGKSRFTKDGWFKSGDIVWADDEGSLHYFGKVETFIRYRGENISPLQIESVLSRHPLVEECIAVGVPNKELGGDDIKVVVVLSNKQAGMMITAAELASWCEKVLPKFMIPRYIEFVSELKKTEHTKKVVRIEYTENTPQTWDRLRSQSAPKSNLN